MARNKDNYSSRSSAWSAYLSQKNVSQTTIDTWIADHTYASYKKLYDQYSDFATWLFQFVPTTFTVTYRMAGHPFDQTFKILAANQTEATTTFQNMFNGLGVTIKSITSA